MKKIKILIADEIHLSNTDVLNSEKFEIHSEIGISNSKILISFSDYKVLIIRSSRKIDKSFILKCPFNVIATCSRGTDHIDIEAAKKRKIEIISLKDANSISTAEHTIALILAIYKNLLFADKNIRKGNFNFYNFGRYELYDKKIGIIGIGRVGSRVARIADTFGMKIIANDIDKEVIKLHPELNFKNLSYLLTNSDIITIHIPMNKKNKNFFSSEKLCKLKSNSVLINISRGEIMDEKFLLKMLQKRKIYFAGIDVYKNEPEINPDFFNLKNVILTNHIAGKTFESKIKISNEIFTQISQYY